MKPIYPSLKKVSLFLFISISLFNGHNALASENTIKFFTAPTHPKAVTEAIYVPILTYLSGKVGKKIELVHTNNFLDYTLRMRKNQFDLAFDGPHFVSWRMKKLADVPLVRLQGQIQVLLAAPNSEEAITQATDLIGRKVCGFPSPNLLTMAILDDYKNPMRQPLLISGKGFKGLQDCIKNQRGQAVILRQEFWSKMDQSKFKLLMRNERTYPERTFSASSSLDSSTRKTIKDALLSPEATPHLQKLLTTFKKKALVPTNNEEFDFLYQLLAPLWGFKID
ncbi:MAG: phosphate/phosphite/phosphonate ABC transporter substrate-binding protein [Gammaproteobacteria bacterium]|nr:phosphate/phosphite/phosphonate ABC transporter substrate-binding protein [Gammaproteobacteria bacterium]